MKISKWLSSEKANWGPLNLTYYRFSMAAPSLCDADDRIADLLLREIHYEG